jgi:hypothetical protein
LAQRLPYLHDPAQILFAGAQRIIAQLDKVLKRDDG